MTVNRTTLLDLPLPVTGTESGTWGDITNNGLTEYLDIAIAGSLALSTDADVLLASTEGTASADNIGGTTAQYAVLRCTGARTVTRNITAPAWAISSGTLTDYSKTYIVVNETTGGQNIVLRATNSATPTYTTGVTIVPGERAVCVWNGSDFVKAGGVIGGSNTQVQYNNGGVLGGIANATSDGTTLSLTSPKVITGINDTNGNELLKVTATASAVNELTLANAATGNAPTLSATGDDTNIGINITPKGSGAVTISNLAVTTIDATNIEVTNIKAKDGTASITLADSTGVASFTANPVLSGGTANGVLYLNGSKVATSGSALTFDGTRLAVNGGANGSQFSVKGTSAFVGFDTGAANDGRIEFAYNGTKIFEQEITSSSLMTLKAVSGVSLSFGANNTEQMRLTSTGLGIGTSSPASKLHVNDGPIRITSSAGSAFGVSIFSNGQSSGQLILGQGYASATDNIAYFQNQSNAALTFGTNATERLRITSAGDVGIGTSSPAYKLTVSGGDIALDNAKAINFKNSSGAYGNVLSVDSSNRVNFGDLVTSASAMVLSSGNLGLGVTPSAWGSTLKALDVAAGGLNGSFYATSTGVVGLTNNYYNNAGDIYVANGYATRYYQYQGAHVWNTAPSGTAGNAITFSQVMTLDASGNLGIGTSSPGSKLHVTTSGQDSQLRLVSTGNVVFRTRWIDATIGMALESNNSTETAYYPLTLTGSTLRIGTGDGSLKATLDSSGNLGLGVTPSAWASGWRSLQLANGSSFVNNGATNYTGIFQNAYYNGTNTLYLSSTYALKYELVNGTHAWYTAPAGTAGDTISFTQAMTLDASGNLGVGTTSPAVKVEIYGTGEVLRLDSAAGQSKSIYLRNVGAETAKIFTDGTLALETNASYPITFSTNNTERARITSGGDFRVRGAGTAGSTDAFQVSGSAPADAARITSGGAFYVGTTTAPTATAPQQVVKSGASDWVSYVWNSNAAPYGLRVQHDTDTNGTGNQFLFCAGNPNLRAEIRSNGGLANYSANDVNLSDRREKTNFAPAKSYLDTICAIPVQTFNYIDQSENDPGLTLGVVAQDVQAVAPELVMESNWGTEDNPKMRLSIYQTDLQYALMKCIQEQQALIQSLTARVALLEGN